MAGLGRLSGPRDLGPHRPQDAQEEEVQQRQQAQLEEAEQVLGHVAVRSLRRVEANARRPDGDGVAVLELVLADGRRRSPWCRWWSPRSTTRKPVPNGRTSAWRRLTLGSARVISQSGRRPMSTGFSDERDALAGGQHERAGARRRPGPRACG